MFSSKTLLLALALAAVATADEMGTTDSMGMETTMDSMGDMMGDMMDDMNSTMTDDMDDMEDMDGMGDIDGMDDMDHSHGHSEHSEEEHKDDPMGGMGCHCMGTMMMGCDLDAASCQCTGGFMPECTDSGASKVGLMGVAIAGAILAASL